MEIQKIKLFGRSGIKVFSQRPSSIGQVLETAAGLYPDKQALIYENMSLTYGQLQKQAYSLAAGLQSICGIKKGDRVATIVGNNLEFPLIVFACAKIGAIMVPVNVKLTTDEIAYIIGHSKPEVLICDEDSSVSLENLARAHKEILPADERIFVAGNTERRSFSFLLNHSHHLKDVQVHEEDPAFILYTSGTTGRPKGAVLSHIGVIHSLINYREQFKTNETMKTLIAVPLFHVTGLVGQLLHIVFIGGTSVILKRYQNEDYIQKTYDHKVNFLFNVPTIFIMMSTSPLFKKYEFDFVKKVAFGGSPIYQQTLTMLRESFPNASLHNAYGATETTSPATLMPLSYPLSKAGSAGLPVPVADLKVMDANGRECPPNTEGELLIKGPMVVGGYWENSEANEKNFIDGYWVSGDIAKIDEEGYVYILDRKKDMISRGGEKIFSIEVEDVLKGHPEIVEAAVVGIPDPLYGERVKAFIVSPNLQNENLEESVKQYCLQFLAKYKVPEEFERIDSLPRNASGKILKNTLRN